VFYVVYALYVCSCLDCRNEFDIEPEENFREYQAESTEDLERGCLASWSGTVSTN
jgi:hypothetical protein